MTQRKPTPFTDERMSHEQKDKEEYISEPSAYGISPDSNKLKALYKNIEDDKLIKAIKTLEQKILDIENVPSVDQDIERIAEQLGDGDKKERRSGDTGRGGILKMLLQDFVELLKVPYGSIGYLIMSDGESIKHLYGVDTNSDFYAMVDGTRLRISSWRLERMNVAGGGKRFLGEEGAMLDNPAETPGNERLADDAINEIIDSIRDMLSSA
jgi:hypothetical protein